MKAFMGIDSEIVIIRSKFNKILGTIISLTIPTRINIVNKNTNSNLITNSNKIVANERYRKLGYNDEKDIVLGCTTFLTVHENYRKKGIGMALIQESLTIAYNIGILSAYFLNTVRRTEDAITINFWIYPINIDKIKKNKIPLPLKYNNIFGDKDLRIEYKKKIEDRKTTIKKIAKKDADY